MTWSHDCSYKGHVDKEAMGAHSSVNTSSVNGIYKVVSTIFQLKSVVSTLNLGCKVRSTLVPSNINTILKSQVIPTAEIISKLS